MRTPEQEIRDYYRNFSLWMQIASPFKWKKMRAFGTSRAEIEPLMREWAQDITKQKETK